MRRSALSPSDPPACTLEPSVAAAGGAGPWLAAATEIADELLWQARATPDGGLNWLGPQRLRGGRPLFEPLGPYLYSGALGVALFLAALERSLRRGTDGEASRATLAALRPSLERALRRKPVQSNLPSAPRLPPGALSGSSSLAYTWLKIGQLLGDPILVGEACQLLDLIAPADLEQDTLLDVMFGCAGALLVFLSFDDAVPGHRNRFGLTPLEGARLCAGRLLAARTGPTGVRVWAGGPSGLPATGFAHGAAGICYALLRLRGRTGDPELLAAALEGLAILDAHFNPVAADWRLAGRSDGTSVNSWCNGAPGLAIGLLAAAAMTADPAIEESARCALERTADRKLDEADHLCCGNLGRADVLLHAARGRREPAGTAQAERLATRVVERRAARGGFGLMPTCRGLFDPRFFLGLPGIGYNLLRVAAAGDLPCILAVE